MDVSQVEKALSKKTRAVLAVHTYGLPVDLDPLVALCHSNDVFLVEDAAEAHGLRYREKPVGSFGIASTFSFYANKNVTAGEGGMVLTSDNHLAEHLRLVRNLSFRKDVRFVHNELGWNMRLSGLQAALGNSQLRRLPDSIVKRRRFASIYREALRDIPGIRFAPAQTAYALNDYWVVGIVLDPQIFGAAKEISSQLERGGVQTRPFFFPLSRQPVIQGTYSREVGSFPVSENLGQQGLYLPNGLGMDDRDVFSAAEEVRRILSAYIV